MHMKGGRSETAIKVARTGRCHLVARLARVLYLSGRVCLPLLVLMGRAPNGELGRDAVGTPQDRQYGECMAPMHQ